MIMILLRNSACFILTLATLWNSSLLIPQRNAESPPKPPPYTGGDIFLASGIKTPIMTCRSNMSYCMFAYSARGNDFNYIPGWCRCRSDDKCLYSHYQSQTRNYVFNCQQPAYNDV